MWYFTFLLLRPPFWISFLFAHSPVEKPLVSRWRFAGRLALCYLERKAFFSPSIDTNGCLHPPPPCRFVRTSAYRLDRKLWEPLLQGEWVGGVYLSIYSLRLTGFTTHIILSCHRLVPLEILWIVHRCDGSPEAGTAQGLHLDWRNQVTSYRWQLDWFIADLSMLRLGLPTSASRRAASNTGIYLPQIKRVHLISSEKIHYYFTIH